MVSVNRRTTEARVEKFDKKEFWDSDYSNTTISIKVFFYSKTKNY